MKILALSDVHGDKHLIREMAEKAAKNKVDLVLLVGDFIGSDGSVEGLVGPFKARGIEVGVLPGNHEGLADVGFLVEKYGVKNLHGYVLKKGDVGIFGCGYGNIGLHQLDEQSIFDTLKKGHDFLRDAKKKIMITHMHPEDSLIGLGVFPGSEGIKKALEEFKPDIHLCGHVHESEGIEEVIDKTRVINVGRKGKIIEI
ncbi:metallophosphoesterase [Candidatus Woesearchaeota archaeon]|nr:metallophosphoesterase [Candidatus Woesearchaeota archaeon]